MVTAPIIGGLLLITGAFLMFQGKIFQSTVFYLVADIIWIYLGFLTGDVIGTLFIGIGALLGLGAFIKMHYGKMHKTLHRNRGV